MDLFKIQYCHQADHGINLSCWRRNYKLDFQNMLSYGIINGNVNSDAINIFGNATGMLNEVNGIRGLMT